MSSNNHCFSENEQQIFLKSLTYILNIDSKINQRKKEYIENQAREIHFPIEEIKNLKKIKKTEEIIKEIKSVSNIRFKRYVLREMILLAIADHELADKEIESIYEIGTHIGIKEEKINDFFIWAAKGVEWQIEGTRLIDEDL